MLFFSNSLMQDLSKDGTGVIPWGKYLALSKGLAVTRLRNSWDTAPKK
jgi:hypothetical protein